MPNLRIIKNEPGDPPPLADEVDIESVILLSPDATLTAVFMLGGMQSGKSSVMFHVKLPDGKDLVFEQSMANIRNMATAFDIWDGMA